MEEGDRNVHERTDGWKPGAKFAQAHRPYDTGTKKGITTESDTVYPTSVCAHLPDVVGSLDRGTRSPSRAA